MQQQVQEELIENTHNHSHSINSIGSADVYKLGYEKVTDECDKHLQLRLNEFISRVEYFQKELANEKYEKYEKYEKEKKNIDMSILMMNGVNR